jgi:hypothetical protein
VIDKTNLSREDTAMSQRAKDLSERIRDFNNEVKTFVDKCSEKDWRKVCKEEWTVGVVAHHIGAGHFEIIDLVKMIINGEKLPELTPDQITQMANQHAEDHADCTKEEVRGLLKKNGDTLIGFVQGLDDAQLDRTGSMSMMGGEVTAQRFIENVILKSGGQHFANMKAAVAG